MQAEPRVGLAIMLPYVVLAADLKTLCYVASAIASNPAKMLRSACCSLVCQRDTWQGLCRPDNFKMHIE